MDWFSDPGYWPSRWVFQRGLGLVYLVAFLSAANQFRALIGEHGLTPAPRYLRGRSFREVPSLFTFGYSDRRFGLVAWSGVVLAVGALVGIFDAVPLPLCMAMWALLWALYLSIVNIGQIWYGFGWESLLLEVGFLAIFLGPAATKPPVLVLWLLRWVLFRVEFGAGLIKIRGDPCWRNLTCLYYHHETQPMPNPLSWYFHHLPKPLHRIEVAGNHFAQLVVPFGLFAPQPVAGVAAAIIVLTQCWLLLSGNFSWLNWVTIVLGLSVIPGSWYSVLPISAPEFDETPLWFVAVVIALTALIAVLSYRPARNLASSHQKMNASFDKLHLVNTYGAFGRITRTRFEVVLEGCYDVDRTAEPEWREYHFKGKPVELDRRPTQFAPYHLRLDWLMWFAALSPDYARGWLPRLAEKLLVNDRDLLKLLRGNPFADRPPDRVRALLYEYHFTDWSEHRRTGAWWTRDRVGIYLVPVHRAGK